MLNNEELVNLFDALGTPRSGRELIMKARSQAPVRSVVSRGSNVLTYMNSRKMGREIATESRHLEFAACVLHEYDDGVLEYYPQPCKLQLSLVNADTGEIHTIQHYPDFLVIREASLVLEEWKTEEKLRRLAEQYSYRYVRDSEGRWSAPQIEEKLAEKGIRYVLRTDGEIPRKRVENLRHLADFYHPATPPCPPHILELLKSRLQVDGHVYLYDLVYGNDPIEANHILKAIADNQVVADLDRESLSEMRGCRLFRDKSLREFVAAQAPRRRPIGSERFALDLQTGTNFVYEAQRFVISLVGEKDVAITNLANGQTTSMAKSWLLEAFEKGFITLESEQASAPESYSQYTEQELHVALQRQKALNQPDLAAASPRTIRRWQSRLDQAKQMGGNETLALVPQTKNRGNRESRLSDGQEALIARIIETEWKTKVAKNGRACYKSLLVLAQDQDVEPPSYPTFMERIKKAASDQITRIREGKRKAYQQAAFVDVLHHDTPQHGTRPFQYVHIDHTQLDIEVVAKNTKFNLGKPWLTLAVDAYSRRILAFYLSFDSPSYHSVAMVIRDLVRRFNRLPEMILTDNGKEFHSKAFKLFLRVFGCDLRFRPAGEPRVGAVLERLFGTGNTHYIHNLAGNTKATKQVRTVTGSHLPANNAEWYLEALYYGIDHWAFQYYDQLEHPTLRDSPKNTFLRGLRESGSRLQRFISFNQDFMIATCPPVKRTGRRRVHNQRGIKNENQYYWHEEFRAADIAGKEVDVRYDPWDASSVYVLVRKRWVQAQCRALAHLGQLTEVERELLTKEYTRRGGAVDDTDPSMQRLREFMQTFTPDGAMEIAMKRQAENKELYSQLQMGSVLPVTPMREIRLEEVNLSDVLSETRSLTFTPSEPLSKAPAADTIPNFDYF